MTYGLTPQQQNLLTVLTDNDRDGKMPSHSEILALCGFKSKSTINRLLNGLEERGYIRRLPKRARAIEIIKHQSPSTICPNCNHEFEPAQNASGEKDADAKNSTSTPVDRRQNQRQREEIC